MDNAVNELISYGMTVEQAVLHVEKLRELPEPPITLEQAVDSAQKSILAELDKKIREGSCHVCRKRETP